MCGTCRTSMYIRRYVHGAPVICRVRRVEDWGAEVLTVSLGTAGLANTSRDEDHSGTPSAVPSPLRKMTGAYGRMAGMPATYTIHGLYIHYFIRASYLSTSHSPSPTITHHPPRPPTAIDHPPSTTIDHPPYTPQKAPHPWLRPRSWMAITI